MVQLKPKYITLDCYGTLTRFCMVEFTQEIFADRVPAEGMDGFIADFSAYRRSLPEHWKQLKLKWTLL